MSLNPPINPIPRQLLSGELQPPSTKQGETRQLKCKIPLQNYWPRPAPPRPEFLPCDHCCPVSSQACSTSLEETYPGMRAFAPTIEPKLHHRPYSNPTAACIQFTYHSLRTPINSATAIAASAQDDLRTFFLFQPHRYNNRLGSLLIWT